MNAAKADIEWEKSQADGSEGEGKLSIEPPSTSYYRIAHSDINVNVRLTQQSHIAPKNGCTEETKNAKNLLELKAIKDATDKWEELSHPNSYSSCIDESNGVLQLGVGLPVDVSQKENNYNVSANDYYKVC